MTTTMATVLPKESAERARRAAQAVRQGRSVTLVESLAIKRALRAHLGLEAGFERYKQIFAPGPQRSACKARRWRRWASAPMPRRFICTSFTRGGEIAELQPPRILGEADAA